MILEKKDKGQMLSTLIKKALSRRILQDFPGSQWAFAGETFLNHSKKDWLHF